MLDQNTDRMWYVIGAILIGAAILFGFHTFMPEAFASVGGMFGQTTEQIQRKLETYGENELAEYVIYTSGGAETDTSQFASDGVVYMTSTHVYDGMYLKLDDLDLETNTEYLLRYTIQAVEGKLFNVGGHMDTPFKNNRLYIDGIRRHVNYHLPGRDKPSEQDVLDGVQPKPPTVFFEQGSVDEHSVEVYIKTTEDWSFDNVHDFDDGRIYIQANRGFSEEPVRVKVSNLELVEVIR